MIPRPLEIELQKFLEPYRDKSMLLAVSGGLDSMAMLYSFLELRKRWPIRFQVAYIHHGSATPDNVRFRNQAYDLVQDVCLEQQVDFFSNIKSCSDLSSIPNYGNSEADLRKLRSEALFAIKQQTQSQFILLAHHKEDLLETRLMRLIRGCGPQGLVAMRRKQGFVLRPFLFLKRSDLVDYLQLVKGHWLEDPSNSESIYFRNWLRHEWLPALESKQPGSRAVLANSLSLIANALPIANSLAHCFSADGKILRSELLTLSTEDKKRTFALYLKQQKVLNYGLSHINELAKRLDVEQKELTFKMLKKNWLANASHIWCED